MKKISSKQLLTNSLSKYLAQAGIASRRKVMDLIKQGLITVNGTIVKEPGYKVHSTDLVKYKDAHVIAQEKIYILLNKPKDYITTVSDEKGRKTVMDLVGNTIGVRLYPVGRLDRNTTGLLLLTNDGDLAQRLSHPRYEIQKVYSVTLEAPLNVQDMARIKKGLELEDGRIEVDSISSMPESPEQLKVTLHSGKNRIVRRIFEHLGYIVKKLDRIEYAGLTKKNLLVGKWRYLTNREIESFQND